MMVAACPIGVERVLHTWGAGLAASAVEAEEVDVAGGADGALLLSAAWAQGHTNVKWEGPHVGRLRKQAGLHGRGGAAGDGKGEVVANASCTGQSLHRRYNTCGLESAAWQMCLASECQIELGTCGVWRYQS